MSDITSRDTDSFLVQQFTELFDNMPQGATLSKIIVDSKGKPTNYSVLAFNAACEKLVGIKQEEGVGRKISEVIPGILEDPSDWLGKFNKVASKGQTLEIDAYFRPFSKYYHIVSYSPKKGYFITVFFDITESKEVDAKLKQRTEQLALEHERFFGMLENLPVMVALLTEDCHVSFANRLFRDKFGEAYGRHCYELIFGQTKPCSFCETFRALQTGKSHHWNLTTPDDSEIEAYDYPFADADGSHMILEALIDITEQKKLEKKLKDSERMAAIGATAGMVGHDIRNPLQAMMSNVYLAKCDLITMPKGKAKDDIVESLDSIQKNLDYVNKIVQDLQDYARPISPCLNNVVVNSIFNDVLSEKVVPRNISVEKQIEPDANIVLTDSDIMTRILANLVNNAIQAMPDGGNLRVYAYLLGDSLCVSVGDTGCGIPKDAQDMLFAPLFTTKSKGQGFGLAVVKRLTEVLGGTVAFESEQGKGTKFTVKIPQK